MGQFGFFDLSDRYAGLDKFGDPLVLLRQTIWTCPVKVEGFSDSFINYRRFL